MNRVTPLNILTAFLLILIGFGLIDGTLEWLRALWLFLLIIGSLVADQLIRVALVRLRKIWMTQLLLIAVVAGIAFGIWYFNN